MALKRIYLPLIALACQGATFSQVSSQPNFLWLTIEDISPHWGAYGFKEAATPNLDSLAKGSVLYSHAFSSAPVCAVTRSGLLTGIYAPAQGTQHMRNAAILSPNVKTYPELLAAAGYFCTNPGKTDYQGLGGAEFWNGKTPDYRARPDKTKPFLHVVNYDGTHEHNNIETDTGDYKPARLTLPPYYPDTEKTRRVWATYLNNITQLDAWIKQRLDELDASGEAGNTIVFIYSDHGAGLPRAKRWCFESGLKIPLLVRMPAKYRRAGKDLPGTVNEELVSTIDLAPTLLNLAGAPIPGYMQGRAFLGPNLKPESKYIYATRDRMDERYDIVRSVRDSRYAYIRNFEYFKPRMQFNAYAETNPWSGITQEIRRVYEAGNAPADIAWYFRSKPIEELYDLETDPHQMRDLSRLPGYQSKLQELRQAQIDWRRRVHDLGAIPEGILLAQRTRYGSEYDLGMRASKSVDSAWDVLDSLPFRSDAELEAMAGSQNESIRYWAITGLANLQSPSASVKQALESALADPSPWIRVSAARGLLLLGGNPASLDLLKREMGNSDATVRLAAVIVCDDLGARAAGLKSALETLRTDVNVDVSDVAVRALATLNAPADLPPVMVSGCPDPASPRYNPAWTVPDTRLCAGSAARPLIGPPLRRARIARAQGESWLFFPDAGDYRVEMRDAMGKALWNGEVSGLDRIPLPDPGKPGESFVRIIRRLQ